jgi:hypothetical protein
MGATYYNKMKGYTDEMVATGKPLEDDDFVSYVLAGLDHDYNSFVENMTGKDEMSLGSLYSGLLAAEAILELQNLWQYQSSVNSSAHGRGGYRGGRGGGRQGEGGGRDGFGHGFGGRGDHGSSSGTKPM